jgi:hypothetical protein
MKIAARIRTVRAQRRLRRLHGVVRHAQATRTWVSGVGDDANPCSRTAPCKTFAGAISKTATGGFIDVLDPGGFGTLTDHQVDHRRRVWRIDRRHARDGGINSVIINGAALIVHLRNLSIESPLPGNPSGQGLNGINVIAASQVHVEHCVIASFSNSAINFQIAGSLFVNDTTIMNNGNGGIVVGNGRATIDRLFASGNGNAVVVTGPAPREHQQQHGDRRQRRAFAAIVNAAAVLNINNCMVSGNTNGFQVNSGATARVSNTLITGNSSNGLLNDGHLVHRVAAGQLPDRQPDERGLHLDRRQAVNAVGVDWDVVIDVRFWLLGLSLWLAGGGATYALPPPVEVSFAAGRVTVSAADAPVADVLAEWSRKGGAEIVGVREPGRPAHQHPPHEHARCRCPSGPSWVRPGWFRTDARDSPASTESAFARIIILPEARTARGDDASTPERRYKYFEDPAAAAGAAALMSLPSDPRPAGPRPPGDPESIYVYAPATTSIPDDPRMVPPPASENRQPLFPRASGIPRPSTSMRRRRSRPNRSLRRRRSPRRFRSGNPLRVRAGHARLDRAAHRRRHSQPAGLQWI